MSFFKKILNHIKHIITVFFRYYCFFFQLLVYFIIAKTRAMTEQANFLKYINNNIIMVDNTQREYGVWAKNKS